MVPITIIILMLGFSFTYCDSLKEEDKRILINDPNYVLQNELQSMRTTIQDLSTKLVHQENEISQLKSQLAVQSTTKPVTPSPSDNGVLYVRWGRKTCPTNDTDILYSGFVGGSFWSHHGAAADYQCLVPDPTFTSKNPFVTSAHVGYMYGGEYESDFYGPHGFNEDAPCAVCVARYHTMQIMLPGRNTCYSGWKKEYSGYLSSNAFDYEAAGQFICVDENPEYVIGGEAGQDGKLLHPVVTVCGSLKCPPYENNKAVMCAVCTK